MAGISEKQKDALIEVINIAFSRSGASLSELTGHRVILKVPVIYVKPIEELQATLENLFMEKVAAIHQVFAGKISGDALLMLNQESAVYLTDLLAEGAAKKDLLSESNREVLNEVGNILLNACLGTFGNILKVQMSFAVSRVRVESVQQLVGSLLIGDQDMRYALIITTEFHVREGDVKGYLVIVLGVSSLDLLLQAVDELG